VLHPCKLFDVTVRSLSERERRQVGRRGDDDRVDLGELGADVLGLRPVVRPIALVELFLMAIGCRVRVSFRRIRLGSVRAGRPVCPGTGKQAGGDPLGGRAGRHRPPAARHHQNPYLKSRSSDDYAK
jgi:hypothetical protein